MNSIQERLENCFALALPELPKEEIPRASMSATAGWSSLITLNLMSLVEEEFGMSVPDADLENFVSFELILDYLQSKTNHA